MCVKVNVLFVLMFVLLILTVMQVNGTSNVVETYGQLQVIGNKICDQSGNPVQLKGMSSHGLQWFPFVPEYTVTNMIDLMGIQVIRTAMYVYEKTSTAGDRYSGYLGEDYWIKDLVIKIVKDAIDEGIYVIIDWHVHWNTADPVSYHWTPNPFTSDAINFFNEMANYQYNGKKFKDYPNLIWEVMNEPGNDITWEEIKLHANAIIKEIRSVCRDEDNLILVPSPFWAQDFTAVVEDTSPDRPDRIYSNIVYTLHFYCVSHTLQNRLSAQKALDAGLALFATEWGIGTYDGMGTPNKYMADIWVNWMNKEMISWTNWSFNNKGETVSALTANSDLKGPWKEEQLSTSGKWVKEWINNKPLSLPYYDEFNDIKNWTPQSGNWNSNDGFVYAWNSGEGNKNLMLPITVNNFSYNARMMILDGKGAFLIFKSSYVALSGYYLYMNYELQKIILYKSSGARLDYETVQIEKNVFYDLRVECIGPSIKVYFDEQLVIDTENNEHPMGIVGIGSYYSNIKVDNIEILPKELPTPSPTPTPEPTIPATPLPTVPPEPVPGSVWMVPQVMLIPEETAFQSEVHINTGTQIVATYSFVVTYNPNVLAPDSSFGSSGVAASAKGFLTGANIINPGILNITGVDANGKGPDRNLTILNIQWLLQEKTPANINLQVAALLDKLFANVGTPTGYGMSIVHQQQGDVNGDLAINIVDALMVAQYTVGLTPVGFFEEAADMDQNNLITIVDALIIAQLSIQ